jgi:hypothetical protein
MLQCFFEIGFGFECTDKARSRSDAIRLEGSEILEKIIDAVGVRVGIRITCKSGDVVAGARIAACGETRAPTQGVGGIGAAYRIDQDQRGAIAFSRLRPRWPKWEGY